MPAISAAVSARHERHRGLPHRGARRPCRAAATTAAQIRIAYNSCRNRHCPKCQGLARAQWLADRQAELLPVPYFHVVFTVPAPIAAIAFQNKAVVYDILFKAAAETLRTIAADPKHLGAEIGLIAVLHTWGQNLHPSSARALHRAGRRPLAGRQRWIACRPGFFLPVRVLSRLFRRLFLERLQAAFDAGELRFFGELARLAEPAAFAAHLRAAAPHRMGGLRQAPVRRAAAGARLSRPLHPSRRHLQQPAGRPRRRQVASAGRTIATTTSRR